MSQNQSAPGSSGTRSPVSPRCGQRCRVHEDTSCVLLHFRARSITSQIADALENRLFEMSFQWPILLPWSRAKVVTVNRWESKKLRGVLPRLRYKSHASLVDKQ